MAPDKTLNKDALTSVRHGSFYKAPNFLEDFAEIWMNDDWVKVEVVKRDVPASGIYLVQRLDGHGQTFKVNAGSLAPLGLHDEESERQIWKRVQYRKLEELLEAEGWSIEKVAEDGNCLYRAAARQQLGMRRNTSGFEMKLSTTLLTTSITSQNLRWTLIRGYLSNY